MSNLNKAMLIGRLGRDPETRYTQSGAAVTSFSVATDNNWKDKQGNWQKKTDWHNIVAWDFRAEYAQNYLKKGSLVYVEGRLQTSDWVDKDNVKHYKTEIVASSLQGLDRTQGGQEGAQSGSGGYADQSQPQGGPQQGGSPQGGGQQGGGQGGGNDEPYLEDDIPF